MGFNIFHNKHLPVGHDQSRGTFLFLAGRRFVAGEMKPARCPGELVAWKLGFFVIVCFPP